MDAQRIRPWQRLDNAAKIFPPNSSRADPKVFRFTCELTEAIDGEILDAALKSTLEDFKSFRYVLKHGLFWYYLEESPIVPSAREECEPPCSALYLNRRALLFEVTWYKKRINLEIYHVLTDGAGAMQFLRRLVFNYLKSAYPDEFGAVEDDGYDASESQKMSDAFDKYYTGEEPGKPPFAPAAYQLRGLKAADWRLRIISGEVSASAVVGLARKYGATVTVLLTAILMQSIASEMKVRDMRRPVAVMIPVDLRNYFDSKSARNFFSIIFARADFSGITGDIGNIIAAVKEQFASQLSREYLQARLNRYMNIEHNIFARIAPLVIKDISMRAAYNITDRAGTAAVSNLGRLRMPPAMESKIRRFFVYASTKKLQLSVCSFGDSMTLNFTSPFISAEIQKNFFRQLAALGAEIEITANELGNPPFPDRKDRILREKKNKPEGSVDSGARPHKARRSGKRT